ncbi:hypothetical protein D3C76_549720 [compost metagenome]
MRETLATEFHRPGHACPALFDKELVSRGKTFRCGDFAVLQTTALLVTVAIERRHHFGGEPRGLFEYAVDGFAVQAIVQLLAMPGHVKQFVQHKTHIAQRRLIVHARPSASPWPIAPTTTIAACCTSNLLLTPTLPNRKEGLPPP